jgi:hypothetical protein
MTNLLDEITGNAMRSQAILSIVQETIAEGSCDLAAVSLKTDRFGSSFGDIGTDEFAAAVEMLKPITGEPQPPITGEPTPVNGTIAPPTKGEPQQQEPRLAQPGGHVAMTRDEANAHLKSLQEALHTARQERMRCADAVRAARSALWTATGLWNGAGGGYSRESLMRDTIAANQQFKQDVKDGKVPPRQSRQVANSYFDRVGSYGRGDATSFVRRSHTPGQPWRGGNRGAFPASMQNAPAKLKGEA